MTSIESLRARLGALTDRAREIQAHADAQGRELTATERAELQDNFTQFTATERELDSAMVSTMDRRSSDLQPRIVDAPSFRASASMRPAPSPSLSIGGNADAVRFLAQYARTGLRPQNAMSIGTDADGGFEVPIQLDRDLQAVAANVSPLMRLAKLVEGVTDGYRQNVATTLPASAWVAEGGTRSVTASPTLAQIVPQRGAVAAVVQASQWIMQDADHDLYNFLVSELGRQFGAAIGAAIVAGAASQPAPLGLTAQTTAATADGARAFGTVEHVATGGATTAPTLDNCITLLSKLHPFYQENASWLMSPSAAAALMTQKASTGGSYLWQPDLSASQPPTLFGKPVFIDPNLPAATTGNALSVWLGDFRRGYVVRSLREADPGARRDQRARPGEALQRAARGREPRGQLGPQGDQDGDGVVQPSVSGGGRRTSPSVARPRSRSRIFPDWGQHMQIRIPELTIPPGLLGPASTDPTVAEARRVLAEATASGAPVVLMHVDSDGGRVDAAFAIYRAIRDYSAAGGTVVAHVREYAASTAPLILVAADVIVMDPAARLIVHSTFGGSPEAVSRTNDLMRAVFEARTTTTREHLDLWLSLTDNDRGEPDSADLRVEAALAGGWADRAGTADDARRLAWQIAGGEPFASRRKAALAFRRRLPVPTWPPGELGALVGAKMRRNEDLAAGAPALLVDPNGLKIGRYTFTGRLRSYSVTLSGPDRSATVVLSPVEPDTDYAILATPRAVSGAAAVNSLIINYVVKNVHEFQVVSVAAPGTGCSVTWDLAFLRLS